MSWTAEDRRAYRAARYKRILQDAKKSLGGRCVDCGSTKNLQFDHVDPSTKVVDISRAADAALYLLKEELTKCALRCQPCHNKKTLRDLKKTPAKGTHGTLSSYRYCHCELCLDAKRRYQRVRNPSVARRRPQHGEYGKYRSGCRCSACRAANAQRMREYFRLRSSTG